MTKEIKKSDTIKMALLEMGFPYSDADNKEAEEVKTANFLFDTAVLTLLMDNCYTGNICKINPVLTDRRMHMGKFEYVKPDNFLCSITPGIEETGENLYAYKDKISLTYKKKMDIKDIPIMYQRYLTLILAKLCCSTVGKGKALNRLMIALEEEKLRLIPQGSFDITMGDLV